MASAGGCTGTAPNKRPDNYGLTLTTGGCQNGCVTPRPVTAQDRAKFQKLNDVRSQALEHARLARELSSQRKRLITDLIDDGYSQSDIAREMGVTRQAVQKMLAAG